MPNSAVCRAIGAPRSRFSSPTWISCGFSATSRSKPAANDARSSPGRPAIRSTCRCAFVFARSQRMLASAAALSWRREIRRCVGDVEGLDADLELQRAGRKARDRRLQRLGQVIRNQFEVQERGVVGTRRDQPEEELEDAHRGRRLEVERAVDELEVTRAALVQVRQFGQQRLERKGPGGPVQGGQAELALERTAARCLDVDRPVAPGPHRCTRGTAAPGASSGGCSPACTRFNGRGPFSRAVASRANVTSPHPVTTWSASRQISCASTSWLTSGPPMTTTMPGSRAFSCRITSAVCSTFQM